MTQLKWSSSDPSKALESLDSPFLQNLYATQVFSVEYKKVRDETGDVGFFRIIFHTKLVMDHYCTFYASPAFECRPGPKDFKYRKEYTLEHQLLSSLGGLQYFLSDYGWSAGFGTKRTYDRAYVWEYPNEGGYGGSEPENLSPLNNGIGLSANTLDIGLDNPPVTVSTGGSGPGYKVNRSHYVPSNVVIQYVNLEDNPLSELVSMDSNEQDEHNNYLRWKQGTKSIFRPRIVVAWDIGDWYDSGDYKGYKLIGDDATYAQNIWTESKDQFKHSRKEGTGSWLKGQNIGGRVGGEEIVFGHEVEETQRYFFHDWIPNPGNEQDDITDYLKNLVTNLDGTGESQEEVEEIVDVVELLYDKTREEFISEFKNGFMEKYPDLMLNEELFTVGDRHKFISWISEQLSLLDLGDSLNSTEYTDTMYDGVIEYKQYLQGIDPELYTLLKIDEACGDPPTDEYTECSGQGPCGCWTYACTVFLSVSMRPNGTPEKVWMDNSIYNTPFNEVQGTVSSSPQLTIQNNLDPVSTYVVRNGWDVRVRIHACDTNGNLLVENSTLPEGSYPWSENRNYVDIGLQSGDHLIVGQMSFDGTMRIGVDIRKRWRQSGELTEVDGYPLTPMVSSIGSLRLEILDVRAPYQEWFHSGIACPPGWGRKDGVTGLAKAANDLSTNFREIGPEQMSLRLRMGIGIEFEILYILSFEVGGFVELKINAATENEFTTGVYAAAKVDIGLASAEARYENFTTYKWDSGQQLLHSVYHWINKYIPDDSGYEFDIPDWPPVKFENKQEITAKTDLGYTTTWKGDHLTNPTKNEYDFHFPGTTSPINYYRVKSESTNNEILTEFALGFRQTKSNSDDNLSLIVPSTPPGANTAGLVNSGILAMLGLFGAGSDGTTQTVLSSMKWAQFLIKTPAMLKVFHNSEEIRKAFKFGGVKAKRSPLDWDFIYQMGILMKWYKQNPTDVKSVLEAQGMSLSDDLLVALQSSWDNQQNPTTDRLHFGLDGEFGVSLALSIPLYRDSILGVFLKFSLEVACALKPTFQVSNGRFTAPDQYQADHDWLIEQLKSEYLGVSD